MIKAVIFDFDGVIADTEHLHYEAFKKVLLLSNHDLTEDEYYSEYLAYDDKTFFAKYYQNKKLYLDKDILKKLLKNKSQTFDTLIKNSIKIYPGIIDFIKEAANKYRIAIGSGALKKEIMQILELIHIADLFETIIAADDVVRCKPNPEVYNKVLAKLNNNQKGKIKPDECIVIEDSIYGIEAAKNAGMNCVAVTNSYPREKLTKADVIVDSLLINDIEDILNNF
jgi:HAD superfamily hydrolase (TIGR01509 family)